MEAVTRWRMILEPNSHKLLLFLWNCFYEILWNCVLLLYVKVCPRIKRPEAQIPSSEEDSFDSVTTNSLSEDYSHSDDHTRQTTDTPPQPNHANDLFYQKCEGRSSNICAVLAELPNNVNKVIITQENMYSLFTSFKDTRWTTWALHTNTLPGVLLSLLIW